ncbi:hypothetical protein [Jannaschia sp. LMIT008]|uniref:hypothetical protein n=1 Tax=Jannaschia maritima TaxID=3032585 RepID=UPI002811C33C|nr:hypothetical protein [Jannaschia sp. LMIT008]
MIRLGLALAALLALGACTAEHRYDPLTDVAARAYAHPGPATLTLVTAINNRSGEGGHSALLVNGSQRVMFDPAGTWRHPTVPERGDVLFGMTPLMYEYYKDYHARPTYHVVMQEVTVPPATAERALQLVQAHGSASKATCGQSVSGILRELGFTQVERSWFPARIMNDFQDVPRVRRTELFDDTEDAYSPERRTPIPALEG